MRQVSPFFTSNASYQIVRVLLEAGEPVSLRQLAYRGGLGIRSVQLATIKLLKLKIILKKKLSNRIFFFVRNDKDDALEEIKSVIKIRRKLRINEQAEYYSKRVLKVVDAIDELNKFACQIRRLNPQQKS